MAKSPAQSVGQPRKFAFKHYTEVLASFSLGFKIMTQTWLFNRPSCLKN